MMASSLASTATYVRFKDKYDQEKRVKCHIDAINKFPTKLALIVERAPTNAAQASSSEASNPRLKTIANPKFMMPKAFTVGEVLAVLRTRLDLTREEGLVLFAKEKYMLRPNTKLEDVYNRYKDEDGFLYLVYAEENIYG